MSDLDKDAKLTCTICRVKQELYCRIVYSQGERVCIDCKKETEISDKAAFDRFQNQRGIY
jgi:hypothetical protein